MFDRILDAAKTGFNRPVPRSERHRVEVELLARYSHGRQIGRVSDALEALVVEQLGNQPSSLRCSRRRVRAAPACQAESLTTIGP